MAKPKKNVVAASSKETLSVPTSKRTRAAKHAAFKQHKADNPPKVPRGTARYLRRNPSQPL